LLEIVYTDSQNMLVLSTVLRPWGSTAPTTRHSLYPLKPALTSPTGGGCSVDIVRSRTKTMEILLLYRLPLHRATTTAVEGAATVPEIMDTPSYINAAKFCWNVFRQTSAMQRQLSKLRAGLCSLHKHVRSGSTSISTYLTWDTKRIHCLPIQCELTSHTQNALTLV
jgi:hypothetical protein